MYPECPFDAPQFIQAIPPMIAVSIPTVAEVMAREVASPQPN